LCADSEAELTRISSDFEAAQASEPIRLDEITGLAS
jgi:hypothetical protein